MFTRAWPRDGASLKSAVSRPAFGGATAYSKRRPRSHLCESHFSFPTYTSHSFLIQNSFSVLVIMDPEELAVENLEIATPFISTEAAPAPAPASVPAPAPTPSADGATEKQKAPERVYPLYSWEDFSPHARLVYIRDPQTAEAEVARFKSGLVGFDLEWKPNWRSGQAENRVALVQIANDDTILLIQVSAIQSAFFYTLLLDILD